MERRSSSRVDLKMVKNKKEQEFQLIHESVRNKYCGVEHKSELVYAFWIKYLKNLMGG